jgi:hypothetical protein
VKLLGLNVYSYIDDVDIQIYKTQISLAKKIDILDWIPGSYIEEIVQGGENLLDRVRCVNLKEVAMRGPVGAPEPLV